MFKLDLNPFTVRFLILFEIIFSTVVGRVSRRHTVASRRHTVASRRHTVASRYELLLESFCEQIGARITEVLQNLHHLIQCEFNTSSVASVELETEVGPGPGHPKNCIRERKPEEPVGHSAALLNVFLFQGQSAGGCKDLTCL